jgi:hypothetical protein
MKIELAVWISGGVTLCAALVFVAAASCKPLPPLTPVDVAAAVECISADEAKGITDPIVIAIDCKLSGAQVVSDIIATLDVRAMRVCRGTIVHPVRVERIDREKD